jgi:hypothetical protein
MTFSSAARHSPSNVPYATALQEYLDRHDHAAITTQLNEVYADADSTLEPDIDALSLETFCRQDWAK